MSQETQAIIVGSWILLLMGAIGLWELRPCKHEPEETSMVTPAVYANGRSFNCVVHMRCRKCWAGMGIKYANREEFSWEKQYGARWPELKKQWDAEDTGRRAHPQYGRPFADQL